jgi:hypothetical protein
MFYLRDGYLRVIRYGASTSAVKAVYGRFNEVYPLKNK